MFNPDKIQANLLENQEVEKKDSNNRRSSGEFLNKKLKKTSLDRRKILQLAAIGVIAAVIDKMKLDKFFLDSEKHNKQKSEQEKRDGEKKERPSISDNYFRPSHRESIKKKTGEPTKLDSTFLNNKPAKPESEIIEQTDRTKLKQEKKQISEIKKIADSLMRAYYELSNKKEFFPPNLFTPDLFIAQQLQESGYDKEAQSRAQAVGVMQVRKIALLDSVRYLNILKRRNQINYQGPKHLNNNQVEQILELIKKDANLGRAIGKIYMAMLLNHYQVGKKDWREGRISEAQKKILAAYNAGHSRIKWQSEKKWPAEARHYYKNIFAYMKKLKTARLWLHKMDFKINNEHYAAMRIVKKVSAVKSKEGQRIIFLQCLKALEEVWRQKQQQGSNVLLDRDIDLAMSRVVLGQQLARAR